MRRRRLKIAAFLTAVYGVNVVTIHSLRKAFKNDSSSDRNEASTKQPRIQQFSRPIDTEKGISNTKKHASFDWNDLDMTPLGANCGMFKCFFRSLSNATLGYLIAAAYPHYEPMKASWEYASQLSIKYRAKHLYLAPPVRVPLPGDDDDNVTKRRLQAAVNQPLRRAANKSLYEGDHYFSDDWYAVQKVLRAPAPILTFGCCTCTAKMKALELAIPSFRKYITNQTAFDEQLHHDRQVVAAALYGDETLWFDFQGMIDPMGNFWFIDLDGPMEKQEELLRIPRKQSNGYVKKRLDYLDKIHKLIQS